MLDETVTLAQIVALLSKMQADAWDIARECDDELRNVDARYWRGRMDAYRLAADAVRRLGDADSAEFTVADKLDSGSLPVPVVECPSCGASIRATLPDQDDTRQPRWDHATLDELVRRRNTFTASWGECIDDMKGETR